MQISRLQPPSPITPKRPAQAAAGAPPAASADALSLSTGTPENAEARALFQKGQALDAQGYTTPANKVFEQAIEAADSVDTLLAIRAIADRNDDGAYSFKGVRSVWAESLAKADQLASKLPVAPGQDAARAHLSQAEKWQAAGLDYAASVNYARAIAASRTLDQVIAVVASMDAHEDALTSDVEYPYKAADQKAKALAEALPAPTQKGDAATRALTAQADKVFRARMPEAGKLLYRRALDSATSLPAAYAVQKSVEALSDADDSYPKYDRNLQCGASGCHDLEVLRGDCKGRIWRLEHPLKVWNPLTWLPNER